MPGTRQVAATQPSPLPVVPAHINGQWYTSLETHQIRSVGGTPLATLTLTPRIKTHELFRHDLASFYRLQATPVRHILERLKAAAVLLRRPDWPFSSLARDQYCRLVSDSTGLPLAFMNEEIEEIADLLDHMEDITRVQLPGSLESALDEYGYDACGSRTGYYPAGKHVLVSIPGNVPTICVYWLTPLVQKIPVILVPSPVEPFTHLVLLQAIKAVDPLLGSCTQFIPAAEGVWTSLLDKIDLAIVPESLQHTFARANGHAGTHVIHYGRTKLLIAGDWDDDAIDVAFRRMMWKAGRTCTGLTSVIVRRDARGFCERLAQMIAREVPSDGAALADRVPRFSPQHAAQLARAIDALVQAGDVEDVTGQATRRPRLQLHADGVMLLPTVLHVTKRDSKAFGFELPFPFISVIEAADDEEMIRFSRNTLILSVICGDARLLHRLCLERSILKIFAGDHLERGYHYVDPHEGYLADFLHQRKAVRIGPASPGS